ncbi:UDP-2,4-diacetamido-2,4,6-trideoxy-beta-L-altropyranose hydrolase [Schinkia azotoformans]|uniref:UDP-2,4-diacetamido-2,4, 6-trideoxy-beta-L-altropyranose hydrolase n=1 Tax=Schinkia azotoformans TaxID=1454 RepID=UPI002DBDA569|nr:UDP-2,4-diacetamido-2,4,6-trideoxy-beta-L-altropyranose hydrolase [Schinkia azotoformans]MEC1719214.1 UDP-2,4-diacetamido-2,4,6-trideoxy-beta-L-altropyranose hydrolase [Schinkia azotoformans]MED4413420.1 UDP-2,4-diacetamido-2,4,6-trideoxy-beta-L-altropyranose hydrolase [Schinkia azotoformans]
MNIFIRVDASNEIGSGHLMRCLTLAKKLRLQGANVTFICREHIGHLCNLIDEKKFTVLKLPTPNKDWELPLLTPHSNWLGVPWFIDAEETRSLLHGHFVDLLIIDHYAINDKWERTLKGMVKNIMVIDDLADRKHQCDLLLDPTVLNDSNRYQALVPPHCKLFLGPSYVLLRQEFYEEKYQMKLRTGLVKRILIFFGGFDHTNETEKALSSFLELARNDIEADVVVGQQNIHKHKLKEICEQYSNLHFHCQVNNMATLMRHADLSIGAGGTTTWERCYLGLPTIVWSIAENQKFICELLGKMKVIKYLGEIHTVSQASLTKPLKKFIENEQERIEMSQLSTALMKDNFVNLQTMIEDIMKLGG